MTSVPTADLLRLLEESLAQRAGGPVPVDTVEQRAFERATSYDFARLRVSLGDGERLELVVKEFGASRLPKDDPPARAEREVTVYRDLLDGPLDGTARLFGIARNPVRLVLEHVDGATLRHHGLGTWFAAASWLGAFQAGMAPRSEELSRCPVLIPHDRAFFLARAEAARTAVAAFGPEAVHRLGAILDGYDRFVAAMVDQPRTLVHGSFRPQNIIVSPAGDGKVRICPVDWELAGLGSPLYDVAFLAEGFRGADLTRLFEAYLGGTGHPVAVAGAETVFTVDCFRLHKIVKSLGDSVALSFRPATVEKLLWMGEEIRARLA